MADETPPPELLQQLRPDEDLYFHPQHGWYTTPKGQAAGGPGFFPRLRSAATEGAAGVGEGALGIAKGLASLPGQVANLPSAYSDLIKSFQAAPGRTAADVGKAAASMLPMAGTVQDIAQGRDLTTRGVVREMTEIALPMHFPKALAGVRDVGTALARWGPTSRVYRGAESSRMAQQAAHDLLGPPTPEAVSAGYAGARAAGAAAGRTPDLSIWGRLANPRNPALPGWEKGQLTPELQAIGARLEAERPGQISTGRSPTVIGTETVQGPARIVQGGFLGNLVPGEPRTVRKVYPGYERTASTPAYDPYLNELFHAYQLTNAVIGKASKTGGMELAQANAMGGVLRDKLADLAKGTGPAADAAQKFLAATEGAKRLFTADELKALVQRSTLPVGSESERVNLGKFMHKLRYPQGRTELTAEMANQLDPNALARLPEVLEPARHMMPESAPFRLGGVASRYTTAGGLGVAAGELLGRALGLPPVVGGGLGAAAGAGIQRGLEKYASSPAGIARTQAAFQRPYGFGQTAPAIRLGPLGPAAAENEYLRRILNPGAP